MRQPLPPLRGPQASLRLIWLGLLISSLVSAQNPHKGFSVVDDISMVRFNEPSADANAQEIESNLYSPDHTHVAILTTRGILSSNEVESSVEVFDLVTVRDFLHNLDQAAPRPRVIATIRATPVGERTAPFAAIIKSIRWSEDSRKLYFLAQNMQGGYQIYEANQNGRSLRALSPGDWNVDRFDVASDTIAYTASRLDNPIPGLGSKRNRDAVDVTGYRIQDILFRKQMQSFAAVPFSMFTLNVTQKHPMPHRVQSYSVTDTSVFLYFLPFRLAPDGKKLVSVEPLTGEIPKSWEQYDPLPGFEHRRMRSDDPDLLKAENVLRPRRYVVIDLESGRITPLVSTPNAEPLGYFSDANLAAWSKDDARVLVTNVFLPADISSASSAPLHTNACVVASIDLPSHQTHCFYFYDRSNSFNPGSVTGVRFGHDLNAVLIDTTLDPQHTRTVAFHFRNGIWDCNATGPSAATSKALENFTPSSNGVQVFVRQALNDVPTLWTRDLNTHTERVLWNPNPQLLQREFGEASVLRWFDRTGKEWIGGLLKPVGYVPGHRYPLVLQMYQFRENEFITDGTDPSAFAARQFASVGFVVLQIRKQPNVLSDEDAKTSLAGFQGAIETLWEDGLTERDKVGVVGFSWTCWYAENALVNAPHLFAAATIADGFDNSYMQYLLFGPGSSNARDQMDRIRGTAPFGEGMKRWLAESPGFHLDKVQTPVRIEAINPGSVLQEWELYASLYMQHKPVDLIYFPTGTHIHQTPSERLESQQGNIDWMRFWLQGYEDPDSSKREQYALWRKLRLLTRQN